MAEGVEEGDEAIDAIEGKGGDGGDVAGAEEGGLQEKEEEEGNASVGEVEGAVVVGLSVDCCRGFGALFFWDCRSIVCTWGQLDRRGSVDVDCMFQSNPGDQGHAEHKIEQSFVRDGEYDKGR